MNPFDISAAIFLVVSMFILATRQSFNPKVKIVAFVFGMIGATLYVIYGLIIGAIGIIILDSIAFFIYIYGIYNCIKLKEKIEKL